MKLKMIKNERIDRVELMRTFVRIVEAGSLSAAAKQIGTTQATVSRRLQSLETLLGVKLLMRTTHAMKLTDDGERGYQHAKKIIDAWLALEDGLNVTEDEPVGTLRVRAPHAFGQQQLLEPLLQFLSRYPQLAGSYTPPPHPAFVRLVGTGSPEHVRYPLFDLSASSPSGEIRHNHRRLRDEPNHWRHRGPRRRDA